MSDQILWFLNRRPASRFVLLNHLSQRHKMSSRSRSPNPPDFIYAGSSWEETIQLIQNVYEQLYGCTEMLWRIYYGDGVVAALEDLQCKWNHLMTNSRVQFHACQDQHLEFFQERLPLLTTQVHKRQPLLTNPDLEDPQMSTEMGEMRKLTKDMRDHVDFLRQAFGWKILQEKNILPEIYSSGCRPTAPDCRDVPDSQDMPVRAEFVMRREIGVTLQKGHCVTIGENYYDGHCFVVKTLTGDIYLVHQSDLIRKKPTSPPCAGQRRGVIQAVPKGTSCVPGMLVWLSERILDLSMGQMLVVVRADTPPDHSMVPVRKYEDPTSGVYLVPREMLTLFMM